jgi:hypothetical protein
MLTFLALLSAFAPPDTVELRAGLVITQSVVVRPGRYLLRPVAPDSVAVRIRGSGILVEMSGVTLLGVEEDAAPDAGSGIGVLIEGGRDIALQRARIRGYKIGVLARAVRNLTLQGLDVLNVNQLANALKPVVLPGETMRVLILREGKEPVGALRRRIFLIDVQGGEVRDNLARRGMNGLQLVRSVQLRIWNNDFSWLSGLGIGLYRSGRNTIMHNRLDYCVRGYVHGVYRRGQDSAALLLYEQSRQHRRLQLDDPLRRRGLPLGRPVHDGHGERRGQRQSLLRERRELRGGQRHRGDVQQEPLHRESLGRLGVRVWGGYSWGSEFRDNTFRGNVTGIAIEHGQDNLIRGNTCWRLHGDPALVEPTRTVGLGLPEAPRHPEPRLPHRVEPVRRQHSGGPVENTTTCRIDRNRYAACDTALILTGEPRAPRPRPPVAPPPRTTSLRSPPMRTCDHGSRITLIPTRRGRSRRMTAMLPLGALRGRETILIDEWGPYDWQRPRLWPQHVADSAYTGGPLVLRVIGPPGRWRVKGTRGLAQVSDTTGLHGGTLVVTPDAGAVTDQLSHRMCMR